MQIVDVHAHLLEAPLSEPFAYSRTWHAKCTVLIVEIDQRLVGWGECYGLTRINAAVIRELGARLIGQDVLRGALLWHEI
jgi:D-galactarolactone cycloisomerase